MGCGLVFRWWWLLWWDASKDFEKKGAFQNLPLLNRLGVF
jgi:hypothetical protein